MRLSSEVYRRATLKGKYYHVTLLKGGISITAMTITIYCINIVFYVVIYVVGIL